MASAFHPDKDIPDLAGKVIFITGGMSTALHALGTFAI
jgi:hypothetical protein